MNQPAPLGWTLLAAGVLVLAIVGGGVLVTYPLRRLPLTWPQRWLYALNMLLCRTLWRVTISGPLPVDEAQGAIIICNHRSSADPCFIEMATGRVVHWLVAKEYYDHWAFHWLLRAAESIPVSRGGIDTLAVKAAIRIASQGGLVGLFPEGRVNATDRILLPARPGAALIALKSRVPVIPCYIRGAPPARYVLEPLFHPAKVEVIVGQPIDLSDYYGKEDEGGVLEDLTRRFLREIAALGGYPDFQPTLAGRFYKPTRNRENGG